MCVLFHLDANQLVCTRQSRPFALALHLLVADKLGVQCELLLTRVAIHILLVYALHLPTGPSPDNYEWAIISAGPPTESYPDGCTTKLTGVNGAGLWLFSRWALIYVPSLSQRPTVCTYTHTHTSTDTFAPLSCVDLHPARPSHTHHVVASFVRKISRCTWVDWHSLAWTNPLFAPHSSQDSRRALRAGHGDAQHLDWHGLHTVAAERRHAARVHVREGVSQALSCWLAVGYAVHAIVMEH